MDELALAVLKAEIAEDCRVLGETAVLARSRIGSGSDPELEACAGSFRPKTHTSTRTA